MRPAVSHSDVGGGYKDNRFDWIPFDYMVSKSEEAGVKFKEKELKRINRSGYAEYQRWLRDNNAPRSNDVPTDNSEWYYTNNTQRNLPGDMLLHPSVRYFLNQPKNDVGGNKYLQ